jgi:DNA-binding NtrC family response regulator
MMSSSHAGAVPRGLLEPRFLRRAPCSEVAHSMADLLVVDDDVDVGETLADVLRDEGHTVRQARNGLEGLERLNERLPDAVLLDVEMPLLSGPQMAVRMFLHNCGQENVPIILQSGVKDITAIASLVQTPYFLSKPFTVEDMLRMIGRALLERVPPRPRADLATL